MGRRLAAAVHVQHPKTHDWLILQPGDEPDEDLAEVITNPDAWGDEPADADTSQESDGDDPGTDPMPDPKPEQEPAAEEEPVKPTRTRAPRKANEEQ